MADRNGGSGLYALNLQSKKARLLGSALPVSTIWRDFRIVRAWLHQRLSS